MLNDRRINPLDKTKKTQPPKLDHTPLVHHREVTSKQPPKTYASAETPIMIAARMGRDRALRVSSIAEVEITEVEIEMNEHIN